MVLLAAKYNFSETHPLLGLRSFAGNEFNEHAPFKKYRSFRKISVFCLQESIWINHFILL